MLLVITHADHLPGETERWKELLSAGADAILLRKPGWSEDAYVQVLEQTDPACYPKMLIAQHWHLQQRYGMMGVHLSESLRQESSEELLTTQRNKGCLLSTSVHDATALPAMTDQWDFLLYGPVFDSISKPGHQRRMSAGFRQHQWVSGARVMALGGVQRSNAGILKAMGFHGLALLGAIWQTPDKAVAHFIEIKKAWNGNAHT
ncbi:MAG TPA: thiamine phosphate synthase [Chitinophaga sp.]